MIEQVHEILNALKRPATLKDIAGQAQLSAEDAANALQSLMQDGYCVETKGKGNRKFAPIRMMHLIRCRAAAIPGAPAFARPLDGGSDLYLDMPDEIALDGDLILVRPTEGERPRGTLIHVVKRAHPLMTGSVYIEPFEPYKPRRGQRHKRPHKVHEPERIALLSDRRLPPRVAIEGDLMGAKAGDLCVFEVSKWPFRAQHMRVRVKQVMGCAQDIGAQLKALLAEYSIEESFPDDVLREAEAFSSSPAEADLANRRDLRGMTIFTIDGADAKDFDDAVSLDMSNGRIVLGVHIADVSHYVTEGSPLDLAARARGTSVYLPGMTIPMLPEALSNGLCSLRPNEDRLTYSLLMTLENGKVVDYDLFPAVIRSCARLTYDGVNDMLADAENSVPEELHETLRQMNELAKRLNAIRVARGALELDLEEPEFDLAPDGMPTDVRARTRGDAHRLIEEFMLLANETVAAHAQRASLPFPYRVHESPDSEKLSALETFLADLGHPEHLGSRPAPQKLQKVLNDFRDRPEGIIVARTLLRAMSRARYSEKPLGHYGLASRDYCHFTSPIRRYPDLLAHRMLKLLASGKLDEASSARWSERVAERAAESSDCEERAAMCERDGDRLMCAAYLSQHIGETFTGIITHLSRRGAIVLLKNTAEGRIPPQLMDDFYSLDDERLMMVGRHTRRVLRLGDTISVEVYSAEITSGEVEFAMTAR